MKKKSSCPAQCEVRVPATTANLGPGFDCLGVALKLYNHITISREPRPGRLPSMVSTIARAFFSTVDQEPFPFSMNASGRVPSSRGLGSSVTIRLGVVAGLNKLTGSLLGAEHLLKLVVDAEGHPDNAVPALYGGFAACAADRFVHTEVDKSLKFIALIPDFEMETKKARAILPKKVDMADAVNNVQKTALITAAFLQRNYEKLGGLFTDRLHQPYRARLIPCWNQVETASMEAGALGFFLSGSGSTLMALALENAVDIAEAMVKAAASAGVGCSIFVLSADNDGFKVTAK